MQLEASAPFALPADAERASLAGRVFRPDVDGPALVAIRGEEVIDISFAAPTGPGACSSSDAARPSQKNVSPHAAFQMGGVRRGRGAPSMPACRATPSEKASSG